MKNKDAKLLIDELVLLNQQLKDTVITEFANLSPEQMHWKPNTSVWNIEEIFAHLLQYYKYYNPVIRKVLAAKSNQFQASTTFTSSQVGRAFHRSMKLGKERNIRKKMKAPKAYNPLLFPAIVEDSITQKFLDAHDFWIDILERSRGTNLRKVKVPISISKILKLPLGDAILAISYHTDRHLEQAMNLKRNPSFPL